MLEVGRVGVGPPLCAPRTDEGKAGGRRGKPPACLLISMTWGSWAEWHPMQLGLSSDGVSHLACPKGRQITRDIKSGPVDTSSNALTITRHNHRAYPYLRLQ